MIKLKSYFATIFLTALIIVLATSPNTKEGAQYGIMLCHDIIIPSLLPILIITTLIINTNCRLVFEKIFGRFTVNALRLPKCTASVIILGLIGGYPAGAILVNELYNNNRIETTHAKRLMRFCFCGGVGFIITGVGTIYLSSTKIGIILYLINALACIFIGVASAHFYPKMNYSYEIDNNTMSFDDAIINAVNKAIKSLLNMSAYIVLFCAITSMIPLPNKLMPIIEISSGLFSSKLSLNYVCSYLAFGGLCIHMQLTPILKNIKMKYSEFLLYRIIASLICFITASVYLKLFPQSIDVFSTIESYTPKLYQVNVTLSLIMAISSCVLILDLDGQNKYHLPN